MIKEDNSRLEGQRSGLGVGKLCKTLENIRTWGFTLSDMECHKEYKRGGT